MKVKINGFAKALEALQFVDDDTRQKILSQIAALDPKMAEKLKSALYRFEDIVKLHQTDFNYIWKEIPKEVWLVALRGSPVDLLIFIEKHIGNRAYEILKSDLDNRGPQPMRKVQVARQEILQFVQKSVADGRMAWNK